MHAVVWEYMFVNTYLYTYVVLFLPSPAIWFETTLVQSRIEAYKAETGSSHQRRTESKPAQKM